MSERKVLLVDESNGSAVGTGGPGDERSSTGADSTIGVGGLESDVGGKQRFPSDLSANTAARVDISPLKGFYVELAERPGEFVLITLHAEIVA